MWPRSTQRSSASTSANITIELSSSRVAPDIRKPPSDFRTDAEGWSFFMHSLPTRGPVLGVSTRSTSMPDAEQGLSNNLFVRRDALSAPDPQQGLSSNLFFPHREERDKNRSKFRFPYPRKNSDFTKQIYTYLIKTGLSDLNVCVHRCGMTVPKLSALADFYLEVVYSRGSRHVHGGRDADNIKTPPGGITYDSAVRVARDAAAFVLDTWDPDYTPRRRREASKGGRASRRGPKHPTSF